MGDGRSFPNRFNAWTLHAILMRHTLYLITIFFATASLGQKTYQTKIFTSDIDNFWIAYDSVLKVKDTTLQKNIIQTLYYDKATKGLKEFMKLRQHASARLLKNILSKPKFWVSLRPHTLMINSYKNDIDKLMINFRNIYPKFKQPEIYFTIGILNSGGTTTKEEILIGTEIAAADSTIDASELGNWLRGVFKDNKNIVYMVAHEVGHTQQKDGDAEANGKLDLLGYCIREGACDFIAEILLEKPIVSPYLSYGKANEKVLWTNFKLEMYGQETNNWLYNGGNAPNGHADLGYFIGYSICKAYYDNAKNKTKALKTIVSLDYTSRRRVHHFFDKSMYAEKQNGM